MGLSQTIPPYAEPLSLAEAKAHLRVDISDDDTLIGSLIALARQHVEAETHNQMVTATWQVTHRFLARRKVLLPIGPSQSIDQITYTDFGGTTQTIATSVYDLLTDRLPGILVLKYLQIWPTNIQYQENSVKIGYKAGYITPFTADASADTLTILGRTFALGDRLRVSNSGGSLPTPLSTFTDYFVVNPTNSGATIQLSLTSGGAAIDLTDAGSGSNFIGYVTNGGGGVIPPQLLGAMKLLISHWYENREATAEKALTDIPRGVDALLTNLRIVEFE